jgi:hypothetical protein
MLIQQQVLRQLELQQVLRLQFQLEVPFPSQQVAQLLRLQGHQQLLRQHVPLGHQQLHLQSRE